MTGALAVRDDLPDLLGTAPADLVDDDRPPAVDYVTARRRAARIRRRLATYTEMRQDIADAYACRDWAVLGYGSWYRYLEGEFAAEMQHLARSREDRRQAVADLRGQGLSTRQIATATGVDPKTVRNDLDGVDQPAAVTGTDGKTYSARRPSPAATSPAAAAAAGEDRSPAGWAGQSDSALSSPAGRDLEDPQADSGPAVPPAVATPGQPGHDPLAGVGDDYERDPAKRLAAVAAVAPAFVQPAAAADRRAQITTNVGSLALAINNLHALVRDAGVDDVPLFALRQQRDDLDRLIRRLETTAAPTPEGTP